MYLSPLSINNNAKYNLSSIKRMTKPTIEQTNSVDTVNFKGREAFVEKYIRTFEDVKKYVGYPKSSKEFKFSEKEPRYNEKTYKEINSQLINSLKNFPDIFKASKFNEIYNKYIANTDVTNFSNTKYLREISLEEALNVSPGDEKVLLNYNSKPLLVVRNLGPYDEGFLFSDFTEHNQVVLEYRHPENNQYIGFSVDEDFDYAITTEKERNTFYRTLDQGFRFKSYSDEGYKPRNYIAYLAKKN